jgi:hypothetical protein
MAKLVDFKTNCIRQFVGYMKRWLSNWELKQEFLVNLRSEFAIKNTMMHQALADLRSRDEGTLWEVEEVYARIEENYKLGNSFY